MIQNEIIEKYLWSKLASIGGANNTKNIDSDIYHGTNWNKQQQIRVLSITALIETNKQQQIWVLSILALKWTMDFTIKYHSTYWKEQQQIWVLCITTKWNE